MTGVRRELPRSKVAGHRRAVPHRALEGSPCGRAHPLLKAESLVERSGAAEWLVGCDRPDEAGELAGAGDDDLLLRLAGAGHPLPALVEALLAAPGALDHDGVLAALAAGQLVADLRAAAGVPGRLDQQPAHMAVADLGDRTLAPLPAGAGAAGHEPDEGHELLGAAEAAEVADLGHERERAQRVDAAQAAQPGDQLPPRLPLGRFPDRPLQLLDACVDEIDRVQVAVEGDLLGRMLEPLLAKPLAPRHRPGSGRQQPPVAQAELRQAVAVAHPVQARVLTRSHEIAGGLELRRGHVDRLEKPDSMKRRELTRVQR